MKWRSALVLRASQARRRRHPGSIARDTPGGCRRAAPLLRGRQRLRPRLAVHFGRRVLVTRGRLERFASGYNDPPDCTAVRHSRDCSVLDNSGPRHQSVARSVLLHGQLRLVDSREALRSPRETVSLRVFDCSGRAVSPHARPCRRGHFLIRS
jgi:hypothetical protein